MARWDYPHWVLSEDLDATRAAKPGAKKKQSDDKLLAQIPTGEENAALFDDLKLPISKATFKRKRQQLDQILVTKVANKSGQHENAYYQL